MSTVVAWERASRPPSPRHPHQWVLGTAIDFRGALACHFSSGLAAPSCARAGGWLPPRVHVLAGWMPSIPGGGGRTDPPLPLSPRCMALHSFRCPNCQAWCCQVDGVLLRIQHYVATRILCFPPLLSATLAPLFIRTCVAFPPPPPVQTWRLRQPFLFPPRPI
jgi:hypothetical protein